jgi:hypothetical protein
LESKIIEGQKTDKRIFHIKEKMKREPTKHFRLDEQGVLWFKDRLVVPKDRELKNKLMDEAHHSKLSIHPGSSKNVPRVETSLLVDQDEKGDCSVCCPLRHVLQGKSSSHETRRTIATLVCTRLEMG